MIAEIKEFWDKLNPYEKAVGIGALATAYLLVSQGVITLETAVLASLILLFGSLLFYIRWFLLDYVNTFVGGTILGALMLLIMGQPLTTQQSLAALALSGFIAVAVVTLLKDYITAHLSMPQVKLGILTTSLVAVFSLAMARVVPIMSWVTPVSYLLAGAIVGYLLYYVYENYIVRQFDLGMWNIAYIPAMAFVAAMLIPTVTQLLPITAIITGIFSVIPL